MTIAIKWKKPDGKWQSLPITDIAHMSRSHALNLLNRPIPVTIRQDEIIISNQMDIRNMYRKQGKRIHKLEDCKPDDRTLAEVGFV